MPSNTNYEEDNLSDEKCGFPTWYEQIFICIVVVTFAKLKPFITKP